MRTIRGEDRYGDDLSGAAYEGCELVDVDLTEVRGNGASFVECRLVNVVLSCAILDGALFERCTFVRTTLFDASLTDCKLVGSTFTDCRFDQLKVDGGDWSFVSLVRADLRQARLADLRMREADLSGARLGSVLRCDLAGATWRGADLSAADLRGSELSALAPADVTLAGAVIDGMRAVTLAQNMGLDIRAE